MSLSFAVPKIESFLTWSTSWLTLALLSRRLCQTAGLYAFNNLIDNVTVDVRNQHRCQPFSWFLSEVSFSQYTLYYCSERAPKYHCIQLQSVPILPGKTTPCYTFHHGIHITSIDSQLLRLSKAEPEGEKLPPYDQGSRTILSLAFKQQRYAFSNLSYNAILRKGCLGNEDDWGEGISNQRSAVGYDRIGQRNHECNRISELSY